MGSEACASELFTASFKTNLANSLCSNLVVLTTLFQLFTILLDISSISRSVETRSIPKEFQMTTPNDNPLPYP